MILKQWVDSELRRAVRKALDFWYNKLSRDINLMDFIHMCRWRMRAENYVVIYRGPEPKDDENFV
jgi:hypothetical protein